MNQKPANLVGYKKGDAINPFPVPAATRKKIFVTDKGQMAVEKETGVVSDILIRRAVIIDKSKFIKVYMALLEVLPDLNKPGLNVLRYLLATMPIGIDWITIDLKTAVEITGYKDVRQIYVGLDNLAKNNIIAKRSGSGYWINTAMLYNGKRIKK